MLDFLNSIVGSNASDITEYRFFLFGLALVVMMIFRPQGLIPSRQRAAELTEATGDRGMAAVAGVDQADVVAEADDVGDLHPQVADDVELPDDYVARADEVAEEVLVLDDVTMQFGGVVALNGVSITVHQGQIFGIIGPNGAGKTTVFNCITGVFQPTSGDIRLEGASLVGRKPHKITEAGVARTFQNIRLFPNMTAIENVMVGTDARHTTSVPGAVVGHPEAPAARRRSARPRPCGSSSSSASPPEPTTWPATSPTATSAASRSPGPSPRSRRCCCSTSRPPASTRPRSRPSSSSSARSAEPASPSC